MDRWIGKVAVVTGASAGIGASIAVNLAKAGLIVIGLARRTEPVDALRATLPAGIATTHLHSFKCDVREEADVKAAFAWITRKFGGCDVLINNAGVFRTEPLIDPNNTEAMRATLETNVMGVFFCTRESFQSMRLRNVAGHVVIINSTAGHVVSYVMDVMPSLNMYPPSKHALTAMTEVFRQEFFAAGTKVKITVCVVLLKIYITISSSGQFLFLFSLNYYYICRVLVRAMFRQELFLSRII